MQTSTDGFIWNSEARYIYYPHSLSRDSGSPLARVELGEYNVQGLDYYYTLQGWLKGVNMPMEGDPGTDGENGLRTGRDAFAFSLGYHEKDYSPIGANLTLSDGRDQLWERYKEQQGTTGLYNGNISWMSTDLPGLDANKRMQAMVYGYDQLHRIVQARSLTEYKAGTGYAKREKKYKKHAPYDVDYSYDPNGNLLSLQRRDHKKAMLDNFKYGYYHGTNRLWHTAADDGDNYQYDPIGNLISDAKEGVQIGWNPYGKVRNVTKSDSTSVKFRYDAAGNRIAKITDSDSTIYVRDASGNVMAVYQNGMLSEQSIYGSSRLGLHHVASKPGYRTLGHKQYELSNHLGNVLATVTDNIHLNQDSTWAKVSSISDYYPFGLTMEGRSLQDSSYRYGFNGKENDRNGEWGNRNHYDYGFRIYNPSIAKFLSVDPLASEFPWNSTYAFAENDVIRSIDLEGLEKLIVTKKSNELANSFAKVLKSDEVLKREVLGPISNPALKDKIHIYFLQSDVFTYKVDSRTKGITYRSFDVSEMINNIHNYENGSPQDKKMYSRYEIEKNKKFINETGLSFSTIKNKIDKGIKVFFVVVNEKSSTDKKGETYLHEVYLHLRNFDKANAKKDHIWGFGEEAYPAGSNPIFSPEVVPPNSNYGRILKRYRDAKEKLK